MGLAWLLMMAPDNDVVADVRERERESFGPELIISATDDASNASAVSHLIYSSSSPFASDAASSCALQDIRYGPCSLFGLALYDARREAEECLVSTCANLSALSLSLSLYPPLQFFPIFFRTHFCQVYFLRLFRFPSVCATLCVLSFPICCARCLIFLLSASYSRFVVKFCHGVSIEVLINMQYLCIHTLHTHRHIYAVYVCQGVSL